MPRTAGAKTLSPQTVIAIREQAAAGVSDRELATKFNITESCVVRVRTGESHVRVGGPRTFRN